MKLPWSKRRAGIAVCMLMLSPCCSTKDQTPRWSGFIEATQVMVSSKATGKVCAVRASLGQAVAAGDTLAQIDTLAVMLRLRQSEAAREAADRYLEIATIAVEQATYTQDLARREYDRVKSLIQSGSVDQRRYDMVETAYKQAVLARRQADATCELAQADLVKADADVSLLRKEIDDCFPRAPISGIVTSKTVRAGEWVEMGEALVKIAQLDTVLVNLYIPATDATRIKIGGKVVVGFEGAKGLEGVVTWVSDEAEFSPKNVPTGETRADQVYAVKITIPNPGHVLKVGMLVTATVE